MLRFRASLYGLLLALLIAAPVTAQDASSPLLQDNLQIITPENVNRLQELARSENNAFGRLEWLADSESSFVVHGRHNSPGIWIHDTQHLESEPRHLEGRGILSPDGQYWAVQDADASTPTLLLIDIYTGEPLHRLQHDVTDFTDFYNAFAFDADSTRIASAWGYTINIWDTSTGNLVSTILADTLVTSLSFSQDGSLIAAGMNDASVNVWEVSTGQLQSKIQDHSNAVYPRFVTADNWLLVSSVDRTVTLWDVYADERLLFVPAHTDLVYAHVTGNHKNVVVSDATVRQGINYSVIELWDVVQDEPIAVHELTHNNFGSLIPGNIISDSEDSLIVFWTANDEALLIDADSGQQLYRLMHSSAVEGAVLSPDSRLLVSWSDGLYFWDVETGDLRSKLDVSLIHDVIFSPDGRRLVSAHTDGIIRLRGVVE